MDREGGVGLERVREGSVYNQNTFQILKEIIKY